MIFTSFDRPQDWIGSPGRGDVTSAIGFGSFDQPPEVVWPVMADYRAD